MRVVSHVGSRAGEVVDLPVLAARAMLADGRATPVPLAEDAAWSVTSAQVTARDDRGMPSHKRRRTR
jgi:hypothetical protein